MEVRDFKQLEGFSNMDFSNLKVKKVNRTSRMLIGTIVVPTPDIDNSVKADFVFHQKQGGEYRKLPYSLPPKSLCEFCNEDIYFYPEVVAVSDFPRPLPCPLPQVKIQSFIFQNISMKTFSGITRCTDIRRL